MDNQTILDRFSQAREIMRRDMNGSLDKAKRSAMANGRLNFDSNRLPLQESTTNMVQSTRPIQNNYMSPAASKLPKAILESMKSNPIESSSSILDELNKTTNGKVFQESLKEQEFTQQNNQNNNSNIDYSMIRMICEETMRKYIGSLKKTFLNESKQNIVSDNTLKAMKIGDKFSFIDSKGNIYEAKLTLKGNVHDKK